MHFLSQINIWIFRYFHSAKYDYFSLEEFIVVYEMK